MSPNIENHNTYVYLEYIPNGSMTFDDLNGEYNFPGGKDVAARANAILDADQVAKDLHLMVETVPQMARFLGIKMDNTEASDSEDIARLASQKVVVYSHIQ